MAVKDVFSPKPVNQIDPKSTKEELGEWEKKRKEAKAQREYMEEQRNIDRILQPEQPPEPQFQVRGGVNIDIDPLRDAKEARETSERVRKEKEDEVKEEKAKRERAEEERRKAEDDLKKSEMASAIKELGGQFATALKEMNTKIDAVKAGADPVSLVSQFSALEQLTKKINEIRMEGGGGVNPSIQLEITKLNIESARAEREFQVKMKQDDRNWELEKIKLQDQRYFKQQEAERQQRKDDMFASAPQVLGGAIARGIMEKQAGRVSGSVPPPTTSKTPQHHVEAPVGEAGEVECAGCSQPVAIGPTARNAVCSNCGMKYSVRRIEGQPTIEEE